MNLLMSETLVKQSMKDEYVPINDNVPFLTSSIVNKPIYMNIENEKRTQVLQIGSLLIENKCIIFRLDSSSIPC